MEMPDAKTLRSVVRSAFMQVGRGRSTDDVVIDDELNKLFTDACREMLPSATTFDCNWTLYLVRKDSSLGRVTEHRRQSRHGDYLHAAEIAARQMEDRHQLSIDRVLCHPDHRKEFDSIASGIAPGVSTYLLRKAALKLRKGRKLKPELIKRVADWGRSVASYAADRLVENPDLMPFVPGIYIFSDRTGYLYIGEAERLRSRVSKHLDHSDRKALARYFWEIGTKDLMVELHAFNPESDGNKTLCRRAYEADLIQNRSPRFNIQGNPSST